MFFSMYSTQNIPIISVSPSQAHHFWAADNWKNELHQLSGFSSFLPVLADTFFFEQIDTELLLQEVIAKNSYRTEIIIKNTEILEL